MSVTIYDIARKAKVGIGTVSRVFNNHPSVSARTRNRVLAVARKLHYRPHPVARALAGQHSNSILAFVPFFPTHFFSEVLQGVQSRLSDLDWELILYGINHPDQLESSIQRHAVRSHMNGILLFSMRIREKYAKHLLSLKPTLVLVDAFHPLFDSITVNNRRGGYLATQHLIASGHRRVGFLNANPHSTPARERLKGYKDAMKEADLEIRPEWVRQSRSKELDGFTRETGTHLMKEFLTLGTKRPTAVFVASDIQAIGALRALEESGLRCPDDMALVGFDDIELSQYLNISTIRQPMFQMGALAVDIFHRRLVDRKSPPTHTQFVPELVVRKSSNGHSRTPLALAAGGKT
ncbi:MAG: LacI family transcriptional regulator [Bacteroidia bacterium]|nr:MAG: LacI family transcriptional regulator [Bacteroidia bacterium]